MFFFLIIFVPLEGNSSTINTSAISRLTLLSKIRVSSRMLLGAPPALEVKGQRWRLRAAMEQQDGCGHSFYCSCTHPSKTKSQRRIIFESIEKTRATLFLINGALRGRRKLIPRQNGVCGACRQPITARNRSAADNKNAPLRDRNWILLRHLGDDRPSAPEGEKGVERERGSLNWPNGVTRAECTHQSD